MLKQDYTKAILVLEDSTVFTGNGFGYPCCISGEVVFNTGMVGYTESLTDPSYFGQILMQTYPLIGNYGVPSYNITDKFGLPLHFESAKIQVRGYIVSSLSKSPSHWSMNKGLNDWLIEQKIPGIEGIDTRELTKKLRIRGTMLGILKVGEVDIDNIKSKLKKIEDPNEKNLVKDVSIDKVVNYRTASQNSPTVVLIDCGVKYGILRNLLNKGVNIVRVPFDYPAEKILNLNPSGIVISNGPGNPKRCLETINIIRKLMETDIPILGICLGLQLLVLASGGDTYKLKFGHRGQNHPCVDSESNKCYITSQNHGFAADSKSLEQTDFLVNLINANDKTVEGIAHKNKLIFATQFHPEASPGPYETEFFFNRFIGEVMKCQS